MYRAVRCIVSYGVSCRTVYRTVRCIVPCGGSYYYSLLLKLKSPHGTVFCTAYPRDILARILADPPDLLRTASRGCHENATRILRGKLLPWNLSINEAAIFKGFLHRMRRHAASHGTVQRRMVPYDAARCRSAMQRIWQRIRCESSDTRRHVTMRRRTSPRRNAPDPVNGVTILLSVIGTVLYVYRRFLFHCAVLLCILET